MERIVEQNLLYDFYGELLTAHQKEIYGEHILNVHRNDVILQPIGKYLTFYDTRQNTIFNDTFHDVIRESLVLGVRQHIAVKMRDDTFRHVVIQSTSIRDFENETIGMIVRLHMKTKSEL